MTDGINGSNSLSPIDQARARVAETRPETGKPFGSPEVKADVSVAISDLAQARYDSLMQPASAATSSTMQSSADNGGIDFGVDRGGFEWPLDTGMEGTAAQGPTDSVKDWQASKDVVNGVYSANVDASESAYIALGKSTVNAAD